MRFIPIALLMLCHLAVAQPSARDRPISVVTSDASAPYQEALRGIAEALPGQSPARALLADRDREQISRIASSPGAIAIALGSRAAESLAAMPGDLLSCMVLDRRPVSPHARRYSVVLTPPVDLQLDWIRKIQPSARRLLLIYTPQENDWRIEPATRAAARLGMTLVLRPAASPEELPGILDRSGDAADAILGLPDAGVFNRSTARALLLFSYRNRIPLYAPADNWVAAGALFALGWNYQDLGRQCGEIAAQLAQGRPPSIHTLEPRTGTYSLNRRALEHFRISVPDALLQGAGRVHD